VKLHFQAFLKKYLCVAAVLLAVDWVLGVARFRWPVLGDLLTVINFPLSLPFQWLETKSNPWWHEIFGNRRRFPDFNVIA